MIAVFLGFLSMIAGGILAHVSRSGLNDVCRGYYLFEIQYSYLETHYNLQIRVFWRTLLALLVFAYVKYVTNEPTYSNDPTPDVILIFTGFSLIVWLIYRIRNGMTYLKKEKPV